MDQQAKKDIQSCLLVSGPQIFFGLRYQLELQRLIDIIDYANCINALMQKLMPRLVLLW